MIDNSTPQKNQLEIALVGGGVNSAVGYAHFVSSQLDGHARIVAGCFSTDATENVLSAERYRVSKERTYDSWQALLEKESTRLDAVVVLTPIPTHKEIVISALSSGLKVICEKALATSSLECQEINEAVKKNKGYLAITYNYTGYPMVRELKAIIDSGEIGEIKHIQVEMPQQSFALPGANPQPWRKVDYDVPTVSLDLGSHVHHLIDFVTGGIQPIEVVSNQANHGLLSGVIDNISCMARYEAGIHVNAWWGKIALGHTNGLRIRIYGTEGSAEWRQIDPETLRMADHHGRRFLLERGQPGLKIASDSRYERFKAGHPAGFIEAFGNLYCDIYAEICGGDGANRRSEYVSGAAIAVKNLRFLEKIQESYLKNRWVSI